MDESKSAYSIGTTAEAPRGIDANKRRFIRTLCRVPANVKPIGADISLSCTITDISPAGCYMEMLAPLPIETRVEVTLFPSASNLECMGVVRHSLSGMGMGVRFDSFTPVQLKKLKEIIPEIPDIPASALSPSATEESVPPPISIPVAPHRSHPASAVELLEATLRVLLRKGIITRAEVAEELEKAKLVKH